VEGRLKKKKNENYYLDEDSWSSGTKKVLLACGAFILLVALAIVGLFWVVLFFS
jgi:hypothetical protein